MSRLGFDMALEEDDHHARRRGSRGALFVVVAGVVVVMLAGFLVLRSVVGSGTDYSGEGTGTVAVRVAPGDSVSQIAKALVDADVVKTAGAFIDVARADDRAQSLPPGTYTLREQMSAQSALDLMLDPASRRASRLVVPEGQRVSETVAAASKASGIPVEEFERVLAEPRSYGLPAMAEGKPEGFLFPATYDLATDATARSILTQMTRRFDQAAKTVGLEEGAEELGLTPREIVTVASILEIESSPQDYPKVARVIYNRLDEGMRLQLDSTVNYALGITELNLSAEQLAVKSPYNTYLIKGLPPGPINSPGEQALEAALAPAAGNWLYFVATDPSQRITKFTDSYQQFLAYKREFQQYLKTATPRPSGS